MALSGASRGGSTARMGGNGCSILVPIAWPRPLFASPISMDDGWIDLPPTACTGDMQLVCCRREDRERPKNVRVGRGNVGRRGPQVAVAVAHTAAFVAAQGWPRDEMRWAGMGRMGWRRIISKAATRGLLLAVLSVCVGRHVPPRATARCGMHGTCESTRSGPRPG